MGTALQVVLPALDAGRHLAQLAAREQTREVWGEHAITPPNFWEMPLEMMQAFVEHMEPPGPGKSWMDYLPTNNLLHQYAGTDSPFKKLEKEIKAKVAFSVWGASKSAVAAVEKAGGSVA